MRLGKADVQLSGLLGQRYGTVFEVQGKQLVATANAELYEDIVIGDCASPCLFKLGDVIIHTWFGHLSFHVVSSGLTFDHISHRMHVYTHTQSREPTATLQTCPMPRTGAAAAQQQQGRWGLGWARRRSRR